MASSDSLPSAEALEEVRRLAGASAVIRGVTRLEGGQHANTWRVDTEGPESRVVVRQFPVADSAGAREHAVLRALDGLGGWAPVWLGGDLTGRWSIHPVSLISWLDGRADITPADPEGWACELGRALAVVHATTGHQLAELPRLFAFRCGSEERLQGPLAPAVRARWSEVTGSPEVLTHCDFWSGNVVWRGGRATGIVDWSDAARGPRGFDIGWCRLDLVLLFDGHIADVFLAAYEAAIDQGVSHTALWDGWAVARSHDVVESWAANYAPLGRADLTERELRRRHSRWAAQLLTQS